jgi:hypothetical protein
LFGRNTLALQVCNELAEGIDGMGAVGWDGRWRVVWQLGHIPRPEPVSALFEALHLNTVRASGPNGEQRGRDGVDLEALGQTPNGLK